MKDNVVTNLIFVDVFISSPLYFRHQGTQNTSQLPFGVVTGLLRSETAPLVDKYPTAVIKSVPFCLYRVTADTSPVLATVNVKH